MCFRGGARLDSRRVREHILNIARAPKRYLRTILWEPRYASQNAVLASALKHPIKFIDSKSNIKKCEIESSKTKRCNIISNITCRRSNSSRSNTSIKKSKGARP